MAKLSIRNLDFSGKEVLMRVDFNVPLKDGVITDDTRIQAAVPTIRHLVDGGAKLVLCSHLGRPKGGPEAKYSLAPTAAHLASILGKIVKLAPDCVGAEAAALRAAPLADTLPFRCGNCPRGAIQRDGRRLENSRAAQHPLPPDDYCLCGDHRR